MRRKRPKSAHPGFVRRSFLPVKPGFVRRSFLPVYQSPIKSRVAHEMSQSQISSSYSTPVKNGTREIRNSKVSSPISPNGKRKRSRTRRKKKRDKFKKMDFVREYQYMKENQCFRARSKILREVMKKQNVKVKLQGLNSGISLEEFKRLYRDVETEISIIKRKLQNNNPSVLHEYKKVRAREMILEKKEKMKKFYDLLVRIDEELRKYEDSDVRGTFEEALDHNELNQILIKEGEVTRDAVINLSKKKVSNVMKKQKENAKHRFALFKYVNKSSEDSQTIGGRSSSMRNDDDDDDVDDDDLEHTGYEERNNRIFHDDVTGVDGDSLVYKRFQEILPGRKKFMDSHLDIMKTHIAMSSLKLKEVFSQCKEINEKESGQSIENLKKTAKIEKELYRTKKIVSRANMKLSFLKNKLQERETRVHQLRKKLIETNRKMRSVVKRVKESDESSFDKRWILEDIFRKESTRENEKKGNSLFSTPAKPIRLNRVSPTPQRSNKRRKRKRKKNQTAENEKYENSSEEEEGGGEEYNITEETTASSVEDDLNSFLSFTDDEEKEDVKNEEAMTLFDPRFKNSKQLTNDLCLINKPSQIKLVLEKFFLEREKLVFFLTNIHDKASLLHEHLEGIMREKVFRYDNVFLDQWNRMSKSLNDETFRLEKESRLHGKYNEFNNNNNNTDREYEVEDTFEEVFGIKKESSSSSVQRNIISQQIHDILKSGSNVFEKRRNDPLAVMKSVTGIILSLFYLFRKLLSTGRLGGLLNETPATPSDRNYNSTPTYKNWNTSTSTSGGWKIEKGSKLKKLQTLISQKIIDDKKVLYSQSSKETKAKRKKKQTKLKLKKAFEKTIKRRRKSKNRLNLPSSSNAMARKRRRSSSSMKKVGEGRAIEFTNKKKDSIPQRKNSNKSPRRIETVSSSLSVPIPGISVSAVPGDQSNGGSVTIEKSQKFDDDDRKEKEKGLTLFPSVIKKSYFNKNGGDDDDDDEGQEQDMKKGRIKVIRDLSGT